MRLAIVGIRGIPNNYGGFETLTEYLVKYLSKDLTITVYCSSKDMDSTLKEYNGATLKYIPVSSHGAIGILYDSISLLSAVINNDKILFLGFGAGFIIPFLKKKNKEKIILNIGGLDWKRSKWSPFAQKIIKMAEKLLIKHSWTIISDNEGIQNYITDEYGKNSTLIAYGGDQAVRLPVTEKFITDYPFLKGAYAFTVTRIQSDNNIDMILESFTRQAILPLVIVGNWSNSEYGRITKNKFLGKNNLILLDAIYDRAKLDVLRSNCTVYIHGHSAGGTNPSLAEAMYLGLPIFAFASGYNEYTTKNEAFYFNDSEHLLDLINNLTSLDLKGAGEKLKAIAEHSYRWSLISDKYKEVIFK